MFTVKEKQVVALQPSVLITSKAICLATACFSLFSLVFSKGREASKVMGVESFIGCWGFSSSDIYTQLNAQAEILRGGVAG